MGLLVSPNIPRRGHASVISAWLPLLLLLSAVCIPGWFGSGAARGQDPTSGGPGIKALKVESSTPEAVSFAVADLEPAWTEVPLGEGKGSRFLLQLPGFSPVSEPGGFKVPRTGSWIVVPPGTRPELRVIREDWQPAGGRPLMVEPLPVILEGSRVGENSVSEIVVLPGEEIPAGLNIPPAILEARATADRGRPSVQRSAALGQVVEWRGRRIVPVHVTAVRIDGSGNATQFLRSGAWEVRFVEEGRNFAPLQDSRWRRTARQNDRRFGSAFLNGKQLDRIPTEGAWRGSSSRDLAQDTGYRAKAGTPRGHESRLGVSSTGLQRVTYQRLRDRGLLPPDPITEGEIRLYQRRFNDVAADPPYYEIEVPIHMVGEGPDDLFDGDDFFVFYGLRLRDDGSFITDFGSGPVAVQDCGDPYEMYSGANFYWLMVSEPETGTPWARMATAGLPAASGGLLPGYRRTEHHEEQLSFRENLPWTTTDRVYFNTHVMDEVTVSVNTLWAPDTLGSNVEIDVGLAGFSSSIRDLVFDWITDNTEETPLGGFALSTTAPDTAQFTMSALALNGSTGKVRITNPSGPNGWLFSFVNWVEISYDALYRATSNRVDFHCGIGDGLRSIEVEGFTSPDLALVDVTDPRRPVFVELSAANIVQDSSTWTLSVMPSQTGLSRRFTAFGNFSGNTVPEFDRFKSDPVLDPRDPRVTAGGDPDLVVITHEDFEEGIDRWVEHRKVRSGGTLEVHVVRAQDIYDSFGTGMKDMWSVRRFMEYALNNWSTWALMVVGDANENMRELGVLPQARPWSTDWVPTHYHVQRALTYSPELMATDKWYVTSFQGADYPLDPYPDEVFTLPNMLTGRFPCNNVGELDAMIDKVITVENTQPGQTWRSRGIFFADDEWSNGYGAEALNTLTYKSNEIQFFESEEDSLAMYWRERTPVTLQSSVVLLKDTLDPEFPYTLPNPPPRSIAALRSYTAAAATPKLIQALNQGALVAHYQGHANPYVLASEYWIQDRGASGHREDVGLLANGGKPWLYFGLGCHIADWAQSSVKDQNSTFEQSLAEKFLVKSGSGASGAYASSGFEFITANRLFGEYLFRRWTMEPPTMVMDDAQLTHRSRWVTGELLWTGEADFISAVGWSYPYQEMLTQYVLLGDPLMVLDAGEPVVTATLVGTPDQEISGEVDLEALDPSNLRTVQITALDEAGIDRLQIVDSSGNDLTGALVTESFPPGAVSQQTVYYSIEVPVRPYDHSLTVKVFDTGAPLATDRHYELILNMPQTADFYTGGEVIDPTTFVFKQGEPVNFQTVVTSSSWLSPAMEMTLTSETLELEDIVFTLEKGPQLDVDFRATATGAEAPDGHTVVLTIDGEETEFVLQQGAGSGETASIGSVYNFPNPMTDTTRFIFESTGPGGSGQIRVFSVGGRTVARLDFQMGSENHGVVDWDGRDEYGDELGNGTYMYRVEIDGADGQIVSDMQRLVMMR